MHVDKFKCCNEETHYIMLTHTLCFVTDITVITHVNIGTDHRRVTRRIILGIEVGDEQGTTQIGSKKTELKVEMRNRLKNYTTSRLEPYVIQQSATRLSKIINKPLKLVGNIYQHEL